MGSETKHDRVEIRIACDPTALDAGQRERKRALQDLLRADVREIREIEGGYAFKATTIIAGGGIGGLAAARALLFGGLRVAQVRHR